MKTLLAFLIPFLPIGLFAQWTSISSSNFYDLSILKANDQTAIYKSIPCEIQLISLKNKKLRLVSTNTTIEQKGSEEKYIFTTNESNAKVQIYEEKNSKLKLIDSVEIPVIEIPKPTDFWLIENNLIEFDFGFLNIGNSNNYNSLINKNLYVIESWTLQFNRVEKSFNGNGARLSQEVKNFLKYHPDGVGFQISITCLGADNEYFTLSKNFSFDQIENPASKYVILNNTNQNKAFFDTKDQNSLIGMLNNNYKVWPDLSIGRLREYKSTTFDGEFVGSVKDAINLESLKSIKYDLNKNQLNLKFSTTVEPLKNEKMIFSGGELLPVYYKKGNTPEMKLYFKGDVMIEKLDSQTETLDPNEAELIPGLSDPYPVEYRLNKINFAYTTDSIQQIIIRYDSLINLISGQIEVQPTRISLARKLLNNSLPEIVFSISVKELLSFESYAPTLHFKNDKSNAILFDLENSNSLLGILNSNYSKEKGITSFPMLYPETKNPGEFGDDCDPNGKTDEKLVEIDERIEPGKFEKVILQDGMAFQVYVKKGFTTENKTYENENPLIERLDESSETIDPLLAELIPGTTEPYPVECQIKQVIKRQYKGITDMYVKNKYTWDLTFKTYVSRPITLGFAQQMPNQSKPTLIAQVDLTENPELLKLLPLKTLQIFSDQPWLRTILFDEVAKMGETIIASDIQSLQNKIQFRKKLVSIDGKKELINTPHF